MDADKIYEKMTGLESTLHMGDYNYQYNPLYVQWLEEQVEKYRDLILDEKNMKSEIDSLFDEFFLRM